MTLSFDDDLAEFEKLRLRVNRAIDPIINACQACGLTPAEGVAALALASYGLAKVVDVDFDSMVRAIKETKTELIYA